MKGRFLRGATMSDESLYKQLAASVGPMATLPNNGASYHSGEQIVTHLNRVLGPLNWSFRILDAGEEPDSDECWVFAEITASIDGVSVVKQDYGSQAFKRSRATKQYVSKWDDKKAATTDALKRAARLLGVGLDAWANEKAPSWHPDLRSAAEADYAAAASQAVELGHPHAEKIKTTRPDTLTDDVLASSTRKLSAWIAANSEPPAA